MEKISSAQAAEVLSDAATALRAQQAKIAQLESEIARRAVRDQAEKVAAAMHQKGLNLDTPVDVLADDLEKAAAAGKLGVIEQAVEFQGPDMGTKIAQLHNDGSGHAPASSDLERFLLGSVG